MANIPGSGSTKSYYSKKVSESQEYRSNKGPPVKYSVEYGVEKRDGPEGSFQREVKYTPETGYRTSVSYNPSADGSQQVGKTPDELLAGPLDRDVGFRKDSSFNELLPDRELDDFDKHMRSGPAFTDINQDDVFKDMEERMQRIRDEALSSEIFSPPTFDSLTSNAKQKSVAGKAPFQRYYEYSKESKSTPEGTTVKISKYEPDKGYTTSYSKEPAQGELEYRPDLFERPPPPANYPQFSSPRSSVQSERSDRSDHSPSSRRPPPPTNYQPPSSPHPTIASDMSFGSGSPSSSFSHQPESGYNVSRSVTRHSQTSSYSSNTSHGATIPRPSSEFKPHWSDDSTSQTPPVLRERGTPAAEGSTKDHSESSPRYTEDIYKAKYHYPADQTPPGSLPVSSIKHPEHEPTTGGTGTPIYRSNITIPLTRPVNKGNIEREGQPHQAVSAQVVQRPPDVDRYAKPLTNSAGVARPKEQHSVPYGEPRGRPTQYGEPHGTQYGEPCGTQYGETRGTQYGEPRSGTQYVEPRGTQYGEPRSGTQYVQPRGSQYGEPSGTQYGEPSGTQYGEPRGTQYGDPRGSQYGEPRGTQYTTPPGTKYQTTSSTQKYSNITEYSKPPSDYHPPADTTSHVPSTRMAPQPTNLYKQSTPNVPTSSASARLSTDKEVDVLTKMLIDSMDSCDDPDFFGFCAACGNKVLGEATGCSAMDQIFHTTCFRCASCDITLSSRPFYIMEGKPYCEEDYLKTLERCSVCDRAITERILRATGKSYHPGCFSCVVCRVSLDGVPFTVDTGGRIHCIDCFNRQFAPRCSVCRYPIVPSEGEAETIRIVALDRSFHVECYRCEDCQIRLSSEAEGRGCYPLDDHIYCQECSGKRVQRLTALV